MKFSSGAADRIEMLASGPWLTCDAASEKISMPLSPLWDKIVNGRSAIDLGSVDEEDFNLLHYDLSAADDDDVFELRAALDEYLSFLQLEELAVSSGYVSVDEIWVDARKRIVSCLCHKDVRLYVYSRGFIGVRMLAERVGVFLGLPPVNPATPASGGAIRFVGMLSELRLWHENGPIDVWLDVLDYYGDPIVSRNSLKSFLTHRIRYPEKIPLSAVAVIGADMFVSRLSALLSIIPEQEKLSYGMYFRHFLANFFGKHYEMGRLRNIENAPSWPELLGAAAVFSPRRRSELMEEINIFREFWNIAALQSEDDDARERSSRGRRRLREGRANARDEAENELSDDVVEKAGPRHEPEIKSALERRQANPSRSGWWQRAKART